MEEKTFSRSRVRREEKIFINHTLRALLNIIPLNLLLRVKITIQLAQFGSSLVGEIEDENENENEI